MLPRVLSMTSGARYAGVPTRDPGAELSCSCCSQRSHKGTNQQQKANGHGAPEGPVAGPRVQGNSQISCGSEGFLGQGFTGWMKKKSMEVDNSL